MHAAKGALLGACYEGQVTKGGLQRACTQGSFLPSERVTKDVLQFLRECDVEGLCQGFPKRIKLLQAKEGQRLKK